MYYYPLTMYNILTCYKRLNENALSLGLQSTNYFIRGLKIVIIRFHNFLPMC